MSQAQPQQQQSKQPEWKPDSKTRFLIQTDAAFEPRARQFLARKYGAAIVDPKTGQRRPLLITTDMNTGSLSEAATVVVLFFDPDAAVKDEKTGEFRPRIVARRGGKARHELIEEPDLQMTAPIACGEFWRVGTGENDDSLDVPALMRAIGERIHPARVILNDRQAKEGNPKSPTLSVRGA